MRVNDNTKVRLRRGSRLLCPECGVVKAWIDVAGDQAVLECGHHRTAGLLAPHVGCLSIEAILARDPLALSLWPATDFDGFRARGRDLADVIDDLKMQSIRERWAA